MMAFVWKPMALVLAGALALGLPTAYLRGKAVARAEIEAAALVAAASRNQETERTNEEFRSMSEIERCRLFMRDSGLSVNACN